MQSWWNSSGLRNNMPRRTGIRSGRAGAGHRHSVHGPFVDLPGRAVLPEDVRLAVAIEVTSGKAREWRVTNRKEVDVAEVTCAVD